MKPAIIIFFTFAIFANGEVMKSGDYYLDATNGSDLNDGRTAKTACKSIEKLNSVVFQKKTKILLAGGQTFEGNLVLREKSSGSEGQEIIISSFGKDRAKISAGNGSGIKLIGNSHIRIENLEIEGCGRKNGNNGSGIELIQTNSVVIDLVKVSGFRIAGIRTFGDKNTKITRVHALNNGGAGIEVCGWDENKSENIYIAHCTAENNAGDPEKKDNHSGNGIVVGGLKNGLIEYCLAFNNGWDMPRKGNGPVGIWGWNCDNLIIQYCISHSNKSPGLDGGGFDLDGGCINSIIQYNLSYNNEGTGYLLCQYSGAPLWKNNIVRFNVSWNDGLKNTSSGIHIWQGDKGMSDAIIYNNIIVNNKHAVSSTHDVAGLIYRNNIFVAGEEVLKGPMSASKFENNIYWQFGKADFCDDGNNKYSTFEEWAKATGHEMQGDKFLGEFQDPMLVLPEKISDLPTDPKELVKMKFFRYGKDKKSIFEIKSK